MHLSFSIQYFAFIYFWLNPQIAWAHQLCTSIGNTSNLEVIDFGVPVLIILTILHAAEDIGVIGLKSVSLYLFRDSLWPNVHVINAIFINKIQVRKFLSV